MQPGSHVPYANHQKSNRYGDAASGGILQNVGEEGTGSANAVRYSTEDSEGREILGR